MRLDHITPKQSEGCHDHDIRCLVRFRISYFDHAAAVLSRGIGVADGLSGGHSERAPPDPIPNSEVKALSADDSVGSPHVKVGHCQALNWTPAAYKRPGFFIAPISKA